MPPRWLLLDTNVVSALEHTLTAKPPLSQTMTMSLCPVRREESMSEFIMKYEPSHTSA